MRRLVLTCVGVLSLIVLCLADTTQFTDNFTRADNTDLGANWDSGYTSQFNLQIVSNQVEGTSVGNHNLETYNGTLANDHWAQATIKALAGTLRVAVRTSAPATWNGYLCIASDSGNTSIIQRRDAGSGTDLTSSATETWAVNDILRCDASGSTLTLKRCTPSCSTVLTTTDATYGSGRTGLDAVPVGALTDVLVDDFLTGDFTSATSTRSRLLLMGVGR